MAARASASISRLRSDSRLSCSFFPFATANSNLTRPFFKYILVGIRRQTLFARLREQLVDLGAVQQQLPPPGRFVILAIAVRVLADVRIEQPRFVALHLGEAVLQLNLAALGCLDLRAGQRQAGLETFQQVVECARPAGCRLRA